MNWRTIVFIGLLFTTSFGFGQSTVVIPNVFTPNYDGVNDVFEVDATGYEALTCQVYNRHGSLVYRYFGLKGNWDGHTHAGVPCVDGVYFVVIELTLPDGSKEVVSGNVQLLK
ncbi:hypothetical protein DNU06_03155 [Putridiphycobacter roseus]|uniref:Gliding motility-associated C-terminal domain-containing protein n=1 Tax=Putridiphycobacter roseus TaxID=2219161 RepID=A0A2W1NII0_9FLAO|nr:gliding motility-associated C-terminal domain-containing protein [Putridiphycobacter roseus]PZE18843.1 hypothetical protein DNU06_03155 [Putridiphycobacter roseus]